MKPTNLLYRQTVVLLSTLLYMQGISAQCPSNMSFENGNLSSWSYTTDSLFPQPANRVYSNPGVNSAVVAYGVTDAWLGTINAPHTQAGNYMVKIGNRAVRGVADTVYRTYIIDSLTDKLTIYSLGVSQLAHSFHNVPVNESPGFGYEIYINGQRIDCLRGAFFTGNTDNPPVWQLGTFRDTANAVRKSTGWGEEVLNFACFVGDTVEVRLFTRDCILLGHYAYAYFDVVCGDTSKPVISQISVNDLIASDTLNLYCVPGATLYLEPQTDVCPFYMGNIQWTPQSFIVGPTTLDSAVVTVTDSVWIYAEAQFSNYCMTVDIIDSVFVRVFNADPLDNVPRLTRNFCDCAPDTIDLSQVDVDAIWDDVPNTHSLNNGLLITSPCDRFYTEAFWKNASSNTIINNSTIGVSSWSSGNNRGAIGQDSILPGGRVRYTFDVQSGKNFYAGINDVHTSNNVDMDHSVRVSGTNIRVYFGTSSQRDLGNFSGTVEVEFEVMSNRRVRVYVNGALVHTYTWSQRANTPVFPDYSGQSQHNPHITKAEVTGPTQNVKVFDRVQNPVPYNYYLEFTDRCGLTVLDTIEYIPGPGTVTVNDVIQCGLDPLTLTAQSSGQFDRISWVAPVAGGTFTPVGNGTPSTSKDLNYAPVFNDQIVSPLMVEVTATSGRCTAKDTGYITVREIPTADAGPDISTSQDTFSIGGSPAAGCFTCLNYTTIWTQGSALSDSTAENPYVYKNQVGAPYFVLTVTDTNTGCYSFDTVEVYTSMSEKSSFLQVNCKTDQVVHLNWIMLPDPEIVRFEVEYSVDRGRTWITCAYADALSGGSQGTPVSYKLQVNKQQNLDATYRWVAIGPAGEKRNVVSLDGLQCSGDEVFTFFPNPFTRQIEVQIESNTTARSHYTFEIVNQFGQVVHTMPVESGQSSLESRFLIDDLDQLSAGIYYLCISSGDKALFRTMVVKSN